jgi:hypothetical protein
MCNLLPNGRSCSVKLHIRENLNAYQLAKRCQQLAKRWATKSLFLGGRGEGSMVQLVPKTAGGVGARETSSLYHEGG